MDPLTGVPKMGGFASDVKIIIENLRNLLEIFIKDEMFVDLELSPRGASPDSVRARIISRAFASA
jgi:hypothetical protein